MKKPPIISSTQFIILMLLIFLSSGISAQNETAPVKVVVTDMAGKPRLSETVFLTDSVTKRTFKGVSDAKGEFDINLPVGAIYHIRIKAIGDDLDWSTLEIPGLKPDEYYDSETKLTIRFEPARTFTLNNVYFETGKSTLKPSSFAELDEIVEYMKLKHSVRIEIAGHTDDVGDDASNMKLSQDRADAVRGYLLRKGIAPVRVVSVGYGETKPVAYNDTPEGRSKNRRTEVIILAE